MEQKTEADPEMTHMVELSDGDFKTALINVLEGLVKRETTCVNIQGQRDENCQEPSRNTKILKIKKHSLRNKRFTVPGTPPANYHE